MGCKQRAKTCRPVEGFVFAIVVLLIIREQPLPWSPRLGKNEDVGKVATFSSFHFSRRKRPKRRSGSHGSELTARSSRLDAHGHLTQFTAGFAQKNNKNPKHFHLSGFWIANLCPLPTAGSCRLLTLRLPSACNGSGCIRSGLCAGT